MVVCSGGGGDDEGDDGVQGPLLELLPPPRGGSVSPPDFAGLPVVASREATGDGGCADDGVVESVGLRIKPPSDLSFVRSQPAVVIRLQYCQISPETSKQG